MRHNQQSFMDEVVTIVATLFLVFGTFFLFIGVPLLLLIRLIEWVMA
jgi:hypothetical protein